MSRESSIWKCVFCDRFYYYDQKSCPCVGWQTNNAHKNVNPESLNEMYEKMFSEPEENKIIKMPSKHDIIELEDKFNKLFEEPKKKNTKTLVVNFFSGPGAGKSTLAAGVFSELKFRGINCELSAEFAKDLTWEERHDTIRDQIYIFGKQFHRLFRLLGKVDVIITDSPILLTPVYDGERRKSLRDLVIEEHRKMWTYNVFIKRNKVFNPRGRNQNEAEARALDNLILDQLDDIGECYEVFLCNPEGRDKIVNKILMWLEHKQETFINTNI
jgi:hypothetical protein